ncbi:glycoside hydrolase subgroup catalytic core [Trichoderma arundinaceum]|uniref:Glycoside hydrolase subgroup catalytic core n=1 Tax=Trichoderma arundinaceum TaxID=490622 RepID=A0A395NYS6_TRIAR|nr:glycoside hydrolase subgroup catalytic core [Trichoderma arundinaceum]
MWIVVIFIFFSSFASAQTGEHIDLPRWCGKAYLPEHRSFNPGGQTVEPPRLTRRALNVQFKPRYSVYLSDESEGEFVVYAEASNYFGHPWPRLRKAAKAPQVDFNITIEPTSQVLVQDKFKMKHRTHRFKFDIGKVKPRLEPYQVVLQATRKKGKKKFKFNVTSELFVLPAKKKGSTARIDNLSGGLFFRNSTPGSQFEPFLPYGFYAPCKGFLCDGVNTTANIKAYRDRRIKTIVPMMPISEATRPVFDHLNSIDLRFMYELHHAYKNLSAVKEQVAAIKDSDALYAYRGFDEPDGHQDPLAPIMKAGSMIRQMDPYHPVAVTLNCQNYYFEDYTKSADIIMEDVYPLGARITVSKFGTPCNATYGNCGCDNCGATVRDVASRLQDLAQYEQWLNLWPKPKIHNLQSFSGGENRLLGGPNADEVVAMSALALNHGAKGINPWVWPVDDKLAAIHGKFANVVNKGLVRDAITKTRAKRFSIPGYPDLDLSYWLLNRTMVMSLVNTGNVSHIGPIYIDFPKIQPTHILDVFWGNAGYDLREIEMPYGMKLQAFGVDAMSTNIISSMVCCDNQPSLSIEYD